MLYFCSEQVVKVCLEFGARIDRKQEDSATAFHLACSQGTLDIVQLMFLNHEAREHTESMTAILKQQDVLGMIPLHRAAMFDHSDVVQYLIEVVCAIL